MLRQRFGVGAALILMLCAFSSGARGQFGGPPPGDTEGEAEAKPKKTMPPPRGMTRLAPKDDIWIDVKKKLVVVDGHVTLRRGVLEMFACPKGTKDYESIVAVNSKAFLVHTGLLAVGAKPGHPVKFDPQSDKYTPATGPEIDVHVYWIDEDGKKRIARAQEWVRNTRTKKEMTHPWVFGGSGFWTDPETGKRRYYAEGGELICVSNFPTAMMDLPIKSSQVNDELLFEPFTERIPPKGTHVRLVLKPKLPVAQPAEQPAESKPTSGAKKKPAPNPTTNDAKER